MQFFQKQQNVGWLALQKPELTSNTTMLVVHGGADDYTLAKFCKEHAREN